MKDFFVGLWYCLTWPIIIIQAIGKMANEEHQEKNNPANFGPMEQTK